MINRGTLKFLGKWQTLMGNNSEFCSKNLSTCKLSKQLVSHKRPMNLAYSPTCSSPFLVTEAR